MPRDRTEDYSCPMNFITALIDKIRRPESQCSVPEPMVEFLAADQGLIDQWLDSDEVIFPTGSVPSDVVNVAQQVWINEPLSVRSLTGLLRHLDKTRSEHRPEGYTKAQIQEYTKILKAHLVTNSVPFRRPGL